MTLEISDRLEVIRLHLEKAEKNYQTAILLSDTLPEHQRDYDSASSRAYYAMFHAEKALLHTRGISGDSHKHVHIQISNQFVKEGILPDDIGRKIKFVERLRHIADYSEQESATREQVEEVLSATKNFIGLTKELLQDFEKEFGG